MKQIYLDYAATTPVVKEVYDEMKDYFLKNYGNTSSLHILGQNADEKVEKVREKIKQKLNAKDHKVIFTSGGTESNNLAIKGLVYANKEKKHIIISKIEHDCILKTAKFLEKQGYEVTYLNVDKEGFIDLKQLEKSIKKETILVSIMHANNEIGTLQNLKEIGKICKEKKVLFHTDACQSFTKEKIDLEEFNIDLITINAHKIYGPKGIGALVIKNGIKLTPLLHGGGHEYGFRSGTLNVPAIIGFGKAIDVISKEDIKKMIDLRNYMIKEILKKIPTSKLNGPTENRLCNNLNFLFNYIEGESILLQLDMEGICISTGSACSSNTLETNHVANAIGIPKDKANGIIRISLGIETTKEETDIFIEKLIKIVKRLTDMSPLTK
ncbi:MAG: cysteine desulfurase family protein [Candidatus ainarchaeum sp.]|nr:cysteine desulfurase family protein [Candidatus ainarchaeum sp.]MDD3975679.1 cysteine desulfurase family protein [Candidatus ainarchaeum sp.]